MAEINTGYSTYLVSTANLVIESKKIVVFNKVGKVEFAFLNINNIEEKYNILISNYVLGEDYFILEREDSNSSTPFEFSKDEIGFNVIIYINNNRPVGFTEFFKAQGTLADLLKIYIKFDIKTTTIDLVFDNHIEDILDSVSLPVIMGSGRYDYSNSSDVINKVKLIPSYNKYSSHIGSGNNIFLKNRVIDINQVKYKKPSISSNLVIDSEPVKFNINLVGDSFLLYAWNDLSFWVYNLTLGTVIKTKTTLTKFENKNTEILYGVGTFIVCRIKMSISYYRTVLYNYDKDTWISNSSCNVLVNEYDNTQEIKYIEPLEQTNLRLKEFSEIQLNLDIFIDEKVNRDDQLVSLERLVGNWVILRCVSLNEIYYILSGKYMTVKLTKYEYNNTIIVNDDILLVNYSVKYFKIFYGTFNSILDISSGIDILKSSPIYKTELSSLRQSNIYYIPSNIIGASRGLLFYKDSNNKVKIC